MKLWLLKLTERIPPGSATNHSFVVRAEDEVDARRAAHYASNRDDGENDFDKEGAWLNSELTSCKELTTNGPEEVVICDSRY